MNGKLAKHVKRQQVNWHSEVKNNANLSIFNKEVIYLKKSKELVPY